MQMKNVISDSVKIITINQLSKGDVYKRFDNSYGDPEVSLGYIREIHNDGDNVIIETTEFKKKYGGVGTERKNINGNSEIVLFPATPEELGELLKDAIIEKESEIEREKEKLKNLEHDVVEITKLANGSVLKELKSSNYSETNNLKEIESKIK